MTSTTETTPQLSYATSNINDIIQTQKKTLHLFISNPSTRTPIIVLYVATFGGSLHSAVTTYFYLEIGATEIDIGQLGFIISIGALIGAPICGISLDKYGPWMPISITAAACSVGCLWRGMASSLSRLRLGSVLLGIGNNVFTVVLGHLVKSNPPSLRSEVLSGFAVQLTTLQLLGKGIFPLLEYILHNIVGLENVLFRYRIHMGFCTFFCFYGTIALFFDRKNVKGGIQSMSNDIPKPQQKQSDFVDGLLHGTRRLSTTSNASNTKELELTSTSISDSFIDNDESNASLSLSTQSLSDDPKTITSNTTIPEESISTRRTNQQLITTITLTFALLLQSIANTIFTVLWPLLAHDIFDLSAHTFGILTFISSVVSTGAVASFPIIEKLEKVGGRVRCAAKGFGIGSLLCILFCFCSFGGAYQEGVENLVGEEYDNGIGSIGIQLNNSETRSLLDQQNESIQHQLHSRKQLALHFLAAIAFQAILSVLEPSLKSILSLQSSKSKALGGTIGGMQSLLNIGGMVGNLAGTILYKVSRDMKGNQQGGSLPFTVTAFFMFICSLLIWRLEEPAHLDANTHEYNTVSDSDIESGGDIRGCASRVLKFD